MGTNRKFALIITAIAVVVGLTTFVGPRAEAASAIPSNAGIAGLTQPVVGMASTNSGNGYWLVSRDGGIFTFGDAKFLGSAGNIRLNQPIVGMAATPTGNGYWLVSRDGGIFTFGDAKFLGSAGAIRLNKPVVGMAATPTGKGYWLVASDGGIFTYGDASYLGGTASTYLEQPIVGMATNPEGTGYWIVAADGAIYTFGSAPYFGSGRGCVLGTSVAMSARTNRYWVTGSAAQTGAFAMNNDPACPPPPPAPPAAPTPGKEARIAQEIYEKINAERAARGLHPLAWDQPLADRALSWSVEMKQSAGFRHSDLHPLLGRFHIVAENIGTGPLGVTSGSMHVAWMKSTGHRVNVLAPNLEVVGIGVYCAPDGSMWATQNYGRFPGSGLPWEFGATPPQAPIVRPDTGGTSCR